MQKIPPWTTGRSSNLLKRNIIAIMSRLKQNWENYGWEAYIPHFITVIAVSGATATVVWCAPNIQSLPGPLATTTVTLGLVMFGLANAQRIIVFQLKGTKLLQFLIDKELYSHILKFFMECSWSSLSLIIISMFCLLIDNTLVYWIWAVGFVLWVGSLTSTLGLTIRNERLMQTMLEGFLSNQNNDGNS